MRFLVLILIAMFVSIVSANDVIRDYWSGEGRWHNYVIKCDNGRTIEVSRDTKNDFRPWWLDGKGYKSMDNAVESLCKTTQNNIVTVKKDSIIFKKFKGDYSIENGLIDNKYKLYKLSAMMGNDNLFSLASNTNVKLVKCWDPYDIVVDQYDNYKNTAKDKSEKLKSGEYKTIKLQDGFCKVYDGKNFYYVRKKDIK